MTDSERSNEIAFVTERIGAFAEHVAEQRGLDGYDLADILNALAVRKWRDPLKPAWSLATPIEMRAHPTVDKVSQ